MLKRFSFWFCIFGSSSFISFLDEVSNSMSYLAFWVGKPMTKVDVDAEESPMKESPAKKIPKAIIAMNKNIFRGELSSYSLTLIKELSLL